MAFARHSPLVTCHYLFAARGLAMAHSLKTRIIPGAAILLLASLAAPPLRAQQNRPLADAIRQIISRPVFRHARFGIEFYSLDKNQPVYELNAQELFTPASTAKLITEGAALALLGPDYRFHTRVYRTGPVDAGGTLRGDLVLVASGDPNLSQRIRPNGTLAFENDDHCYGGPAVPGDPLVVIKQLAAQVAAHGIKEIAGRVLVDTSLFPEGVRERGTHTVISPIVVNDNLVDVTATPGASLGAPVTLAVSPVTAYVRFVNQATTGPPDSEPDIEWGSDQTSSDGSHIVTLTGTLPLGKPPARAPYA
ncbi:MAG: D-alanyl-D-alanine carboxypeptidase, partial [Terriglobia bacterium]